MFVVEEEKPLGSSSYCSPFPFGGPLKKKIPILQGISVL